MELISWILPSISLVISIFVFLDIQKINKGISKNIAELEKERAEREKKILEEENEFLEYIRRTNEEN